MNADAEFIKLLKDEADKAHHKRLHFDFEVASEGGHKLNLCLYLLKHLGITYTPNSRKDRE